jgi:hypothetical protein
VWTISQKPPGRRAASFKALASLAAEPALHCLRRLGPEGGGASTSQGRPHTVFRRALERGNLLVAEATAREVGRISLAEALELTFLIAQKEPGRHPRVAARVV